MNLMLQIKLQLVYQYLPSVPYKYKKQKCVLLIM